LGSLTSWKIANKSSCKLSQKKDIFLRIEFNGHAAELSGISLKLGWQSWRFYQSQREFSNLECG